MRATFVSFALLTATLMLAGCAGSIAEPSYFLRSASSSFARGDNENGAWYVGRATSKPMGKEAVHEYFSKSPELIPRYLDGAEAAAAKTDLRETIEESVVVLGILSTLPGVSVERLAAVQGSCRAGLVRFALMDEARRDEEARLARAKSDRMARVASAKNAAWISCREREQCDRAFGMAEVFVSQNADMKIQVATTSVIETYNASDKGKVALKVLRVPRPQGDFEISILATCRTDGIESWQEDCDTRLLKIYTDFRVALLPFASRP